MANEKTGAEGASVDFAREVLPILSDKCFVCHGPDTRKKKQLRLDSFAGATSDRGGYRAIDPAAPGKSELLVRIHDANDPMPPPEAEKQLTSAERELLSRWVRQGGQYAMHWAFVPPRKQRPGNQPLATKDVIDAFVQAGLKKKNVEFAPEADRATLARRVALVLTGLPPEPAQLADFLADKSPHAYAQLVEELLASPRFGEHQARYWLDAARYGDTHGLHLDNRRGIYPYRDWVVRAFNENLPLDKFILWQLAGDLLPQPTLEQRVATGFVRMNPTTAEAGVVPEEFQAKNNFDRTENLGTVFLGMTLTCARCHTHKYDPISQTEYYQLFAFFNNTAENPIDGNSYTYAPVTQAPRDQAAWQEWSELAAQRKQLLRRAGIQPEQNQSDLVAYAAATSQWAARQWRISQPTPADVATPPVAAPRAATAAADAKDAGANEKAAPASPAKPAWTKVQGLPGKLKRKLPKQDQAVWISFQVRTTVDQTLWLTFSGGSASQALVDGKAVPLSAEGTDAPHRKAPLALPAGTHEVQLKMAGTKAEPAIEVRLDNPWQSLAKAKHWSESDPDVRLLLLADARGPLAHLQLQKPARELARRLAAARAKFTTTLVAQERSQRRPTHLLRRGEYNHPLGDPLQPDVPAVMGVLPKDAPRNRLGLARWLIDRKNPLVARVLVNRIWQRVFGQGLVRSPEDFGVQGQQPTHPELLDWLAVELQDSGWDLKHMLRLLVATRTFRQDSAWRPEVGDPENRLLARGPSHRLDAEELRDLGLWASGLLDPHMGGEGVKPYQPEGMWFALAHPASNTKRYVQDHGRKLYRRSLYVYWKRTSPHPMMTLFDAPSRESSCVRRSRTNTSLQSLGLLNETQRVEMSRALAERLLHEAHDDPARLNLLFRLLTCRAPTVPERAACEGLLKEMRARYAGAKEDARKLLAVGEAPRDEKLDPAAHAAWTQLAVVMLASDAAITLY